MDFCVEVLGTTVTASQVSTDTYEVTNLISSQRGARARGFMVERFIKPPVDITFLFSCSVDLHLVILCTAVGSQRSVGIDVMGLVADVKKPAKPDVGADTQAAAAAPTFHETVISKCFLQEGEDKICFVNRRYRPRRPFSDWPEAVVPDGTATRDIHSLPSRLCGMRLRLWRSGNASLLAMKSVQIHAAPSRDTPDHVVSRLVALVRPPASRLKSNPSPAARKESETKTEAGKTPKRAGNQYDFHANQQVRVPPEFLDPLTCEIMNFPIILPSGNTVDQTSLDRHVQSESNWGRAPSDPFTGLPLLNSDPKRRVLPNTLLKSRIDRYLLLNTGSNSTAAGAGAAGRTIGIKRGPSDGNKPIGAVISKLSRVENGDRGSHPLPAPSEPTIVMVEGGAGPSQSDVEPVAGDGVDCSDSGDHQSRLDRSLDSALKSALGSLTRYTGSGARANRWENVFAPPPSCGSCRTDDSGKSTPLYRLPCTHLLCRNCVTAAGGQTCSTCKVPFTGSDLARVHLG